MAYEYKEYPDWSWSQTRRNYFDSCVRKYFYYYYASHNGWLKEASPINKIPYRLKQMYDMTMFLGDSIHYHIEQHLKDIQSGFDVDSKEDMYQNIKNQILQAKNDSINLKSEWIAYPKKFKMLQEVYYNGVLTKEDLTPTKNRLINCVHNFFESKTYKEILETNGGTIVECEQLNHIYLDGTKVFVKMDVLYKKPDGTWVIVDWKTGKESSKYDSQILLYMIYVNETYSIPFDKIEIRLEYLNEGNCVTISYDEEKIEKVKQETLNSVANMQSYLIDVEKNIPMDEKSFTANPSPKKCATCNFREICEEKYKE